MNCFDLLVADSQYNLNSLSQYIHRPKKGIHIYPVIEAEKIRNAAFDQELLSSLSPAGQLNFLFVGRIARNKRHDRLMRVFDAFCQASNRRARLWLVGDERSDPVYRRELENLKASLPFGRNIFFTGKVGQEKLFAYYRAADLFLCASEHEGFCIPIAEAMAFSIPVLAYAAAAVPETMGNSGIRVQTWAIPHIVPLMDQIMVKKSLSDTVIQVQNENLRRFSFDAAQSRLNAVLDFLTSGQASNNFIVIQPGAAPLDGAKSAG